QIFSKAKEERIDKQYYTSELQDVPLTKDLAFQSFRTANIFNVKLDILKNSLNNNEINKIRDNFLEL
ncbi:MAG: hypothetical protein U9Q99_02515, partial [Nanoarchaeota archaeon]|nr:hypothetical protein [Nanoarchaeota archaeon]